MKPILFNTDMVRAILDGRKTVTRRVMKPQPWGTCPNTGGDHELEPDNFCGGVATGFVCARCGQGVCPPHMKYPVGEALFRPMCWPGDILYVRETWTHPSAAEIANGADPEMYLYKADDLQPAAWDKWRPSIHMPKEAARLFLRVTDVRVERLQDITDDGAKAEGANWKHGHHVGVEEKMRRGAVERFAEIWDSTIKPADLPLYGWDANPWVWVIEFERCEKPKEG